ncbi:MAG: N-glycosylase/DNA lyase [Treponema sp.]|jgi:N-glycosylase/DNA lyase|nr:N-glycosylase/DNA lyase [Treponema sp.]
MTKLNDVYRHIKERIDERLEEFRALFLDGSDRDVFKEMCFCMCTPQNNARKAWEAVCGLDDTRRLEAGTHEEVAAILRARGVRFHKNKAAYILKNREAFYPHTKDAVSRIVQNKEQAEARDILAKTVAGWGLKEASHFLRNIGLGSRICILDRHILRQLALNGVIETTALSPKTYHDIERRMIRFAESEDIPVDALDLTLWYQEKHELFK